MPPVKRIALPHSVHTTFNVTALQLAVNTEHHIITHSSSIEFNAILDKTMLHYNKQHHTSLRRTILLLYVQIQHLMPPFLFHLVTPSFTNSSNLCLTLFLSLMTYFYEPYLINNTTTHCIAVCYITMHYITYQYAIQQIMT